MCRDGTDSLLTQTFRCFSHLVQARDDQTNRGVSKWIIDTSRNQISLNLPQVLSRRHHGMKFTFISVIWSSASNTLSAISENQHGRECGSRFICFHTVKSKNNPSAVCKNAPTRESFKAFHGRLLRRRVKQHVGVFHTVAQGFAPSSERVTVNEDRRDAAFIHSKIKL